jgi:AraC-like DNA-binding protein/ribosomal protein S18 acetylase RimI-like enzyme
MMKTVSASFVILFRIGGSALESQAVDMTMAAIQFIEAHLNEKMDLDFVANAVHYSKYHLHRIFSETVGLTIHDYVQRRQLTEAAKLLVFSDKSIMEVALVAGYKSQQAFTSVFKSMYKQTPAQFRANKQFYPLQLEFVLKRKVSALICHKSNIQFAQIEDIPDWMALVRLAIDGYPHLSEPVYIVRLNQYIAERSALIMRDGKTTIGAMAFSYDTGSIDFLGVHPQYRDHGVTKALLDELMDELLIGKEISITTFRKHDQADTGYREEYRKLGFAESELLIEYGYPTQRFVLSPNIAKEKNDERRSN